MMEDPSAKTPKPAGGNRNQGPDPAPGQAPPAPDAGVRCVLLTTPREAAPPQDLLDALNRKGLGWTLAPTSYHAMSQIIRAGALKTERRVGARPGVALVVVNPHLRDEAELRELVRSLDRFCPQVARWSYSADATPRLHALRLNSAPTPQVGPVVVANGVRETIAARAAATRPAPQPRLRLADAEGPSLHKHADAPITDDASGDTPASLLSEDELTMLLEDDGNTR
jgi:hypothetical protein